MNVPVISRLQVGGTDGLRCETGRPEINHLDPKRKPGRVNEHDVLWFEVSVNEANVT